MLTIEPQASVAQRKRASCQKSNQTSSALSTCLLSALPAANTVLGYRLRRQGESPAPKQSSVRQQSGLDYRASYHRVSLPTTAGVKLSGYCITAPNSSFNDAAGLERGWPTSRSSAFGNSMARAAEQAAIEHLSLRWRASRRPKRPTQLRPLRSTILQAVRENLLRPSCQSLGHRIVRAAEQTTREHIGLQVQVSRWVNMPLHQRTLPPYAKPAARETILLLYCRSFSLHPAKADERGKAFRYRART